MFPVSEPRIRSRAIILQHGILGKLYPAANEPGRFHFLQDSCGFFDLLRRHDLSAWTVITSATQRKVRGFAQWRLEDEFSFLSRPFFSGLHFDHLPMQHPREANLARLVEVRKQISKLVRKQITASSTRLVKHRAQQIRVINFSSLPSKTITTEPHYTSLSSAEGP